MNSFKKLTVALLIVCSFMFVAPVFITSFETTGYTVEAASNPKMQVKVTKAKKEGYYYVVEGKVYNKTKSKLDSAVLTINLYGKKNKKQKITTHKDSIMWMDAKGTWKFCEKIYVGNKKIKSYKVSASGHYYKKSSYTYSKFKTKITSTKKTTSTYGYDTINIKGTIKNKTGKKMKSVFVTYAFYDKKGNIISTRFIGYYKGYKNNKTFNIKESSHLSYSSLGVKKCKIVNVEAFAAK